MATPGGVHQFDGRGVPEGSKGSNVPSDIGPGRAGVKAIGGGASATPMATGGASATPAGVHKHSGTEDLGSNPKTYQASLKGPDAASGASATPEGVRKFGGTSVKKK